MFSGSALCDWPGLLGANRDGKASEQSSLSEKVSGKPKLAWESPAGQGYAGASIAGDQVCLFDRKGRENRVRLVELKSGKEIWSQTLPTTFFGGMDAARGLDAFQPSRPMASCFTILVEKPTIWNEQQARFVGAASFSLSIKPKRIFWRRLYATRSQRSRYHRGRRTKGGIVCLGLSDGKTLWSVTKEKEASYASPILLSESQNGVAIVPTRTPRHRFGRCGWKRDMEASIWQKITIGSGCDTASIDRQSILFNRPRVRCRECCSRPRTTPRHDYRSSEILSSQYATPVQLGDYLYGCDGREDLNNGSYKCISTKDWKVAWEEKDHPISHSIVIGDKILVTGVDGTLKALRPDPKGISRALEDRVASRSVSSHSGL